MEITSFGTDKALGDIVNLKTSSNKHMNDLVEKEKPTGKSFSEMLTQSLGDVNKAQLDFEDLSVKAYTDPESVNVEDLTKSMSMANMELNIAKNVIDRVLRAYQTLTTLR